MSIGVMNSAIALMLGLVSAFAILLVWIRMNAPMNAAARALMHEAEDSIAFLFDDEMMIDATPKAKALLAQDDAAEGSDWDRFLSLVSARFPHLRSQLSDLAVLGKKTISPEDGQPGWIKAEYWRGLSRLTFVQDQVDPAHTFDPMTASAMEYELKTLRTIGENTPQLIWKYDAEGVLVWANRAYIELSEQKHPIAEGAIRAWPPKDVFSNVAKPAGNTPLIEMLPVTLEDRSEPIWFEITSIKKGHHTLHFGIDSTDVVTAQRTKQSFVQTLAQTFAQLSIGLAIFDAERRLVSFNPAFGNLTKLQPGFLASRPTLHSILDRLRDLQMIPEPKNYKGWRDNFNALESAAAEGSYLEDWALSNGQTLRVTGRPHPDGAIAFLFEDITEAISLTQKFKEQIKIGDAVFNNLPDRIAVFSSNGALIRANKAYRTMWGLQDGGAVESNAISEELSKWREASEPAPFWGTLGEIISLGTPSDRWVKTVSFEHFGEMNCQYAPLPYGNHQVTFSYATLKDTATEFRADNEGLQLKASG